MSATKIPEARVVACIRLDGEGTGFALPLLRISSTGDASFVQEIDEISQLVVGFRKLEYEEESLLLLKSGPLARVGESPIYAFVADDGEAHCGPLDKLKPVLKIFATQFPERLAIQLQITELIGTLEEKRFTRADVRKSIQESAGETAARRFYEGLMRSALWDHLLANAKDDGAKRRILASRGRTSAHVEASGKIVVDLSGLDPTDYAGTSIEAIEEKLALEFDHVTTTAGSNSDMSLAEESQTKRDGTDEQPSLPALDKYQAVRHALHRIQSAGRQEERVAILLDAILNDRETGMQVLEEYPPDRAKYANQAVNDLAQELRLRTHKQGSQTGRFVIQGLRRETLDGSRLFLAERATIRAA